MRESRSLKVYGHVEVELVEVEHRKIFLQVVEGEEDHQNRILEEVAPVEHWR